MLQVLQYQKTGEMKIEDLSPPQLRRGGVLVRNVCSVISAGTEKSSVETAQASLLGKAKSRPDLVKQVMDNVKREGVLATYEKVQNRLDNYKELGYSSAGVVLESAVDAFRPGDRVACAGTAHHAEVISVAKNLVVKMPDGVSFEDAAFTTIGAIALQGVRQAGVHIGENVAVIGLGLIGLITVQLLKSNGCRVVGIDVNENRFELASKLGCELCIQNNASARGKIQSFTRGYGTDAVIITAGTQSNEPIELALDVARKKSKVVIVGAVGMQIPRSPFYEKEIDIRISCSYGPGRYDPDYENDGIDYPIGYVRWTENRNMEAILDLAARKQISFASLITHRFAIADALHAYEVITGKKGEDFLGVVLQYPEKGESSTRPRTDAVERTISSAGKEKLKIGFIGAGNFAQSYLLPHIPSGECVLQTVATQTPAHAMSVQKKFSFRNAGASAEEILNDPSIDSVFIATRHDSHAGYVVRALKAGKNVFVEKPLAVTEAQLHDIGAVASGRVLAVGFNRRFAKPFVDIKNFFRGRIEPMMISYRVNAGALPPTHWVYHETQGGRIIGEACHFIDVMMFLTNAMPVRVYAETIGGSREQQHLSDNVLASITFSDGSVGSLLYVSNGNASVPKEYCEVTCEQRSAIMENFDSVVTYHDRKRAKKRYDGKKGHQEEVAHFLRACRGKESPVPFEALSAATLTTFRIMESLRRRAAVDI